MTTQDLVEKLRRYPVPTVCGAIVLICFFAFYLRMDLLTNLEIENDEVQRQLQQVDQNISHGRTLAADIATMKSRSEELESRLIKPAELANNLKYFYEVEAATHVSLADLRQSAPGAAKAPAKGESKALLAGVGYSILMNGTFHQVLAYINELEHGRHFMRLQSVALQRVDRTETQGGAARPVSMSLNVELLGTP